MTVLSKIAGGAGLVSSLYDIHKTALVISHQEHDRLEGDLVVAKSIGTQKADRLSDRDTRRKNWINENNFFAGTKEAIASVKGYVKGAITGIIQHIPELVLSSIALFTSKLPKVANISAIGLGVVTIVDFIINSTNLFQKTDYLKRR